MTAKIRTAIATLAVALSFSAATGAVAPTDAHAVSAKPTGNAQLDAYCAGVARLINEAFREYEHEVLFGSADEAAAWRALINEYLRRGRENGCQFAAVRVTTLPGHVARPIDKVIPVIGG